MPAPSGLGLTTIVIGWVLSGLAILLMLATVLHLRRFVRPHDLFNLTALIVGLLVVSQTTWAIISEGQGQHQDKLANRQIAMVAKSLIANEALWTIANTLIRVSACLFLRQIFLVERLLRITITVVLILSALHGLAAVLDLLLICRPLTMQWDLHATGACGNQILSYIIVESAGLVLDISILLVPFASIPSMNLRRYKKWLIICCLDVGVILLAVAALRLKSLHLAVSSDFVYSQSYLGLLSAIGCMLGVILCCTPTLLVFWRYIRRDERPVFHLKTPMAHRWSTFHHWASRSRGTATRSCVQIEVQLSSKDVTVDTDTISDRSLRTDLEENSTRMSQDIGSEKPHSSQEIASEEEK
ncbi:hypothetical protein EJ04DRAFT_507371 [Polyplosphaeria fusca]|uniref:Rhodopsin domain-containing protein n=1 Tax=Polyplosphaeria fusca TaxID=682080 RepID=A0A9P4RD37_9PLEO|nr:hypothetical protein EJ04DRAFT_507371 [Polyplosphaeria fusca]